MEEMLILKELLRHKIYNHAIEGNTSQSIDNKKSNPIQQDIKRKNKNRPREISSKHTVKRFRDVVGLPTEVKCEKRDPRFDNMCGEFDEKIQRDAYNFIDDIKMKELSTLKGEINHETDPSRTKQLKYLIQRIEHQSREKSKVEKEKEIVRGKKRHNRDCINRGETAKLVTKQEEKNMDMIEKYEKLKRTNRLE